MRRSSGLVALALAGGTAAAAPSKKSEAELYPGIHRELWEELDVVRLHLVRVDLSSAEIGVYATAERNGGITTSEFASLINAQVAINGGMFAVPGNKPLGLAIGDEAAWSGSADDCDTAVLHFGRSGGTMGERTYATIDPPEALTTEESLPKQRQGAISGRPLLVSNGAAISKYDCDDPVTIPCMHAPRTAVGLSQDGRFLYLVVVNGWRPQSRGMTAAELATFLAETGSHMAFALDGGASTTLAIDGNVFNAPSDGTERAVANHLAIKYQNLPKNTLRGYICSTPNFMNCSATPSLQIDDAKVELDDGRVLYPANPAEYIFTGVTPRYACVTASKLPMYPAKTQCRQVTSGGAPIYNSIHLEPAAAPPPPDPDPVTPPAVAAAPAPCDPAAGDGGDPPVDDPGCCESGDLGRSRPLSSLVLVALVAFMLTRRRGTKT